MNEPNLKPTRRRVPKPIEKRTGQYRLPGAVVTRDFLQAVHDYCAANNLEMSDMIREVVAEKIGYGQSKPSEDEPVIMRQVNHRHTG